MSKRIYLAGPDVFFDKPLEEAAKLKALCAAQGLEGVFPLDASILFLETDTPEVKGQKIYDANVALLRSCDGVLANMMPWRGTSTDVGTAWEMGFASALGLPVVGYSPDLRPYEQRTPQDEYLVESFNLVDNLMLACSIVVCTTKEDAVVQLARVLKP